MKDANPQSVYQRRVFYIPGYDPFHPRRYRELYRREAAEQAAISGYRVALLPRKGKDTGHGWRVHSEQDGAEVLTRVEVLVWSDIVRRSMGGSIGATYGQLLRTVWAYVGSGALWRLMRLRRGPVLAALYPVAMLLAQAMAALALAAVAVWLLPWWAGIPAGAAIVWGMPSGFRRLDRYLFAWYLMHDYAFTARWNGAYPAELETRLTSFADRIAEALAGGEDEVLVIGHSSGAHLAVSILADLTRAGRVPPGRVLSLLTLGQVVPMVSFLPGARRLRADLAWMAVQKVFWLDVTAPGDPCCFALCDPVQVSGVAPEGARRPLVISAAFSRTLSAERLRALRGRFFRLHFRYLCAFDRPEGYDYFRITAGPLTLAERFGRRAPSRGRITRAANRHRSTA